MNRGLLWVYSTSCTSSSDSSEPSWKQLGYPRWDWSSWLGADTISSFTVTVSGVTLDSSSNTDTDVTAWLSGGLVGQSASATCSIVTAGGREDDRTITLRIKER